MAASDKGAIRGGEPIRHWLCSRDVRRCVFAVHLSSHQPSNTKGPAMINLITWLVVGGLIGWVASIVMRTDAEQGLFLNVVVGIVGAALAGWVLSPLLGIATINQDAFSAGALVVSLLGAIVLLSIANLLRRGLPR